MARGELTVSVDEMTGVQAKERIFEDLAPKPATVNKPNCGKKNMIKGPPRKTQSAQAATAQK